MSIAVKKRTSGNGDASTPVEEAIEQFEGYVRVSKSLPDYNVKSYLHYPLMAIVPPFCAERGIATMGQLDRAAVNDLVLSIEKRKKRNGDPIPPSTRLAYLKAVKYFLA